MALGLIQGPAHSVVCQCLYSTVGRTVTSVHISRLMGTGVYWGLEFTGKRGGGCRQTTAGSQLSLHDHVWVQVIKEFESGLSGHSEGIFFSVGRLNLIYLFNSLLLGVGVGSGKLVLVLKEKIFPTNTFFSIMTSVGRTYFHA